MGKKAFARVVFAGAVACFVFLNYRLTLEGVKMGLTWYWLAFTAILLTLFLSVGGSITGHWMGAFIDKRNRMSLSRMQMAAWTVMVLGAYIADALWRVWQDVTDPFNIVIAPELWMAMGLAAFSAMAAPAIIQRKATGNTNERELRQQLTQLDVTGLHGENVQAVGPIVRKDSPDHAYFSDLFLGEEVGNAATVDLGKLQQFMITLMLLTLYGGALWRAFSKVGENNGGLLVDCVGEVAKLCAANEEVLAALPPIDTTFIGLLALSHATYLGFKALPNSAPAPTQPPASLTENASAVRSTASAATVQSKAEKVIEECEKAWPGNKSDCSGFMKEVAGALGVTLTGQADDIVNQIQGPGWEVIADGPAAHAKAESGAFVVAGLKGKDHVPARANGHVVVVVKGHLAHGKYPTAYWGTLGGVGERNQTLNYACRESDRDRIIYRSRTI